MEEFQRKRQLEDLNRSAEYVYDQMLKGFKYSHIYEVDAEKGPIKSLEKALEICEPNAIIRLAQGVYTCERAITKPGITIE